MYFNNELYNYPAFTLGWCTSTRDATITLSSQQVGVYQQGRLDTVYTVLKLCWCTSKSYKGDYIYPVLILGWCISTRDTTIITLSSLYVEGLRTSTRYTTITISSHLVGVL